MKKTTLLAFIAAVATGTSSVAEGKKTQDCYCTDKNGARVELGETRCLNVGGRVFMARCEMSLNVPTWRDQKLSCVTS
jgi:hypothetical protein